MSCIKVSTGFLTLLAAMPLLCAAEPDELASHRRARTRNLWRHGSSKTVVVSSLFVESEVLSEHPGRQFSVDH
jgi:hypothetical protein